MKKSVPSSSQFSSVHFNTKTPPRRLLFLRSALLFRYQQVPVASCHLTSTIAFAVTKFVFSFDPRKTKTNLKNVQFKLKLLRTENKQLFDPVRSWKLQWRSSGPFSAPSSPSPNNGISIAKQAIDIVLINDERFNNERLVLVHKRKYFNDGIAGQWNTQRRWTE